MPEYGPQEVSRLRTKVAKLLQCGVDDITQDSGIHTHPNWDSMAHVGIMVFLANEYGVEINDQTIDRFSKFSEIEKLDH